LIQRELSEIFLQESKALFPGAMLTITVVRMSPDLGVAKVFLSIFTNGDRETFLEKIKSQTKHIRHLLGKKIKNQVKKIPELIFLYDDSIDYYENIDKLLSPDK